MSNTGEKKFFYDFSENISILLHTKYAPSDEEWLSYLRAMRSWRITSLPRVFVLTDGGGPTPSQRQQLQQALAGRPYVGAVLGEAAATRFIVASLALSNPMIRTFYIKELSLAYAHLQLSPPQQEQLAARLTWLSQQEGPSSNTALQKVLLALKAQH